MNKYKEALWSIDFSMRYRTKPKYIRKVEDENFEILYELVEKATPKKPIKVTGQLGLIYYKCPICGEYLGLISDKKAKYCEDCGQALDWSNEG